MPASLLADVNSNGCGLEDQRALQLALELTMLGLNPGGAGSPDEDDHDDPQKLKKSSNMTECVPVPSSEHVAEIVGRQGCKIKALRAKTNTYIKTPVRGEEPVFVVTGRKEDVGAAKREILSAAEHFSQIRASRRNNNQASTLSGIAPGPPSPNAPGQVTIQVRVPYRVVGLVVGPKGATIKRIQQTTHTYIVTPSRDKEPVFEVTGKPENVEKARQEIEKHIAMRTGGSILDANTNVDDINDFHTNGIDSGFHEPVNNELLAGLYKNPTNSAFTTYNTALNNSLNSNNLLPSHSPPQDNIFSYPTSMNGTSKMNEFCNGFNIYDNHDEGFASPTFHPSFSMWQEENGSAVTLYGQTNTTASVPRRSGSIGENNRISPPIHESNHQSVRRISSDPLSGGALNGMPCYTTLPASNFTTSTTTYSNGTSSSPVDSGTQRKGCLLCADTTAVAAFVPCGHNRLCMKCANGIMKKPDMERKCPVCDQTPTQAIRIFS